MQLLGDRQTAITPASGNAATFAFDALGRYASRTIGGVTETYSYIGSSNVVWQDAASTTIQSAIDAAGDRNANQNGSTTSYLLSDLHGNAIGLEDGSTSISDAYRYDAWGTTIDSDSSGTPAPMPWKYQGRLDVSPSADPLYDFGARLYAPASGTFTQLDSVMGSAQDPLSMNRYLYAAANPATLIDPNGHCYLPDRDAVKPGPCPGETTTTKPPASSPDPGSGIGFGNGRVTYEDDNGQVHSTPANHSGSNSFAGGAVPTPTPSSQTTLQTAVLLAGCGADCRVDETGYVYAATGYFADGTAIPWICVGSIDVRACGAQFADQDASAHIPVGEAVAYLAGGFEATFDELATILGDQAASDRLAGLAANGAEGSGAQFFKGLWEEAAGAASKAAGRVVLAVGAALD
ncbi:MAG TPA: RHS repeat-associated core domain-containing protein, partial [Candidatus Limnocylindrales bacterium]